MAYELLNSAQVTPLRLYALVDLVAQLQRPSRETLRCMLQPAQLRTLRLNSKIEKDDSEDEEGDEDENDEGAGQAGTNFSAVDNVYSAASNLHLIEELPDNTVKVQEDVLPYLESIDAFRMCMQKRVWGIDDPYAPNYLFNLYSAWYVVQNEKVFYFDNKEEEILYNEQMKVDDPDERFNTTKFNGWKQWAIFLGLGRSFKPLTKGRSKKILRPDTTHRLRSVLPRLFPQPGKNISFAEFMSYVSTVCPELDGGTLFQRCQEAMLGNTYQEQYLSLALSTGLRTLHARKDIELIRRADAADNWMLYPANSFLPHLQTVTHIRWLER